MTSVDNTNWDVVANIVGNNLGGIKKHKFELKEARYIKLSCSAKKDAFISIFGIEVYKRRVLPQERVITNITPSAGNLIPEVNSEITSYDINVGNETDKITLTPALAGGEPYKAIINDEEVISGSESEEIDLAVGNNYIAVVTMDPNDKENKITYQIIEGDKLKTKAVLKYSIRVRITDSQGEIFEKVLIINITKEDEPGGGEDIPLTPRVDEDGTMALSTNVKLTSGLSIKLWIK